MHSMRYLESSVLCSSCSEKVRPIVAVDIDGTLGDYHSHFLRFANEWLMKDDMVNLLQASINGYDGSISFSAYCGDLFGIDLATYRQIKLAYRQGGMKRSMPILPHAQETIYRLFISGAEVWLTTTRPYLSLDNIVPDTVAWCERHDIEYEGMLFDEDKYSQLAERVDPKRVIAVLDDLPEMVEAANDLFDGAGVVVARPHNLHTEIFPRLPLHHAAIAATTRIKDWAYGRA
jgi:5' nucleotidase, deoxy (Pyrimidine), cytosolic type C protein (NT5C)